MGLVKDHPHRWPAPLQALEHGTFRWLWLATFVSNSGSWMQRVATDWLVYTLAKSEAWLGFDAAMAALPTFLVLPISGVVADRFDRRVVIVVANILNAGLAAILAAIWWSGNLAAWHLLTGSFLAALVTSFAAPATQALIPAAAGEDHIPNAVALNSFQYNVARAIGPAIGGLALAFAGAGWCFVLNSLSYLGLIVAVLAIPKSPERDHRNASALESVREGIRFVRHRSNVQRSILLVILLAFGAAPMVTLLPAIAKGPLNQNASGYSMLLASFGVGAAVAGALLAFLRSPRSVQWVIGATVLCAICHLALALTDKLAVSVAITAIAGGAFVGAMIELGTELISKTPDELRGRISAVQQLGFRTAQPLGGIVSALVAQYAGISTAFIAFGIFLVVGATLMPVFYRRPICGSDERSYRRASLTVKPEPILKR